MEREKDLWDKLKALGFQKQIVPIKPWQVWVNKLFSKPKYVAKELEDNLVHMTEDGKLVEVYPIDIWYIQVSVGGEVVFDARRFKDEELLAKIPDNLKNLNPEI